MYLILFWNKAISAEQRITEIEEGVDRTAIEVITNSNKAREMSEADKKCRKRNNIDVSDHQCIQQTRENGSI